MSREDGIIPVFISADNRHTEALQVLIEAGADVNICPLHAGRSPLLEAIRCGFTEVASDLVAAGANVNYVADDVYRQRTPACALARRCWCSRCWQRLPHPSSSTAPTPAPL